MCFLCCLLRWVYTTLNSNLMQRKIANISTLNSKFLF
nr:MAG TPA: hypothetical protein [Caudoviricetes sp.]